MIYHNTLAQSCGTKKKLCPFLLLFNKAKKSTQITNLFQEIHEVQADVHSFCKFVCLNEFLKLGSQNPLKNGSPIFFEGGV